MRKISWEKWEDVLADTDDKKQFVMHTPLGLIPHKIRKGAKNALNFWICHTNFDIDNEVYITIKNVHGVEILSLFTPYSFRICIGKMFDEKEVMRNIGIALGCEQPSEQKVSMVNKKDIIRIKKEISNKKHWCIYVLPNGSYEYFSTNEDTEFVDPINFYSNIKGSIGGLLFTSNSKIGV